VNRISYFILTALLFLPLVAWSKDAAVVTLVLCALAGFSRYDSQKADMFLSIIHTPTGRFICAFALWSLISLLWTPHLSGLAWLKAFLTIALAAFVAMSLATTKMESAQRLVTPAIYAVLGVFTVLLVERVTGGFFIGLHRSGQTAAQLFNAMNGGLVLLCCTAFPIACLLRLKTGTWRWSALFFISVFMVSASYRMDAVPVALFAGLLSFLMVYRWRAPVFVGLSALIGIAAVCWAAIAAGASMANLDIWFAENIHPNWGYRIAIWGSVSTLIGDKFLIGHGFDAARFVGQTAGLVPDPSGKTSFLHPHNGMLQIWLELGLVGVGLLLAVAISVVRQILKCSPGRTALAAVAGTLSASTTIWLLSYGVWQGWWLAVLGLALSAVILVFRTAPASIIDASDQVPASFTS
jgi:O-antigen ligase